MHSLYSYYISAYCIFSLCLISFDFSKTGCFSWDLDELTSETSISLIDSINTLKEKVKETGINQPEDIPQVSDWIEQCKKKVGGRRWRLIRTSGERIVDCFSRYIKMDEIKSEVNASIVRGELDLVFKKYCGYREQIMDCIDKELDVVKPCLNEQQLSDLNIVRSAANSGIDFICYENGDRIALFMAEDGIQCLTNTREEIKECIEAKVGKVKEIKEDHQNFSIDKLHLNEENCKKIAAVHECVVEKTTTCDDPTPANILDSLIKQVLKETPCAQTDTPSASASVVFYLHFWALLPHVLTLIFAGLTAAHILL